MSENQTTKVIGPVSAEQLREAFGWDTVRNFGNHIQIFLNSDHALFVLREQVSVNMATADGPPAVATKNVASWIVPLDVARQLGEAITGLDFEAVKNAKPDQ